MVSAADANSGAIVPFTGLVARGEQVIQEKQPKFGGPDLRDFFRLIEANDLRTARSYLPAVPMEGLLMALKVHYFAGESFNFGGDICCRLAGMLPSTEKSDLCLKDHVAWAAVLDWAVKKDKFELSDKVCEKLGECSPYLEELVKAGRMEAARWLAGSNYCTNPHGLGRVYVLAISKEETGLANGLSKRINSNSIDEKGNSLLHYAASLGSVDGARDIYSRMKTGSLSVCNREGYPAWALALIESGKTGYLDECPYKEVFHFLASSQQDSEALIVGMNKEVLAEVFQRMRFDTCPGYLDVLVPAAVNVAGMARTLSDELYHGLAAFAIDDLVSKEKYEQALSVCSKLEKNEQAARNCLQIFADNQRVASISWFLRNASFKPDDLGEVFDDALVDKKEKVVEAFIRGLDPNAVYGDGMTLLHSAVSHSLPAVKSLLSRMDDEAVRRVDDYGKTALDYAIEKEGEEWGMTIVDMLKERQRQCSQSHLPEEPSTDLDGAA